MCELLVRSTDETHHPDAPKKGDIILIKEDGQEWGRCESKLVWDSEVVYEGFSWEMFLLALKSDRVYGYDRLNELQITFTGGPDDKKTLTFDSFPDIENKARTCKSMLVKNRPELWHNKTEIVKFPGIPVVQYREKNEHTRVKIGNRNVMKLEA